MPITLDASVGGSASNSYATVAEADLQASLIIGPSAAAWVANSDVEAQKQALITATRDIDTLDFIGLRASDTQALEWPRDAARTLTGRLYSSSALPASLVAATIELAINYLANATSDVLNPVANDKKKVKAGDVEVEYFAPGDDEIDSLDRFPASVANYLRALVRAAVEAGWGTGVSIRTS